LPETRSLTTRPKGRDIVNCGIWFGILKSLENWRVDKKTSRGAKTTFAGKFENKFKARPEPENAYRALLI
jgi:hypothetical protein